MPKLKTHRGAAKRFRKTGGGNLKRSKAFKSHHLGKKRPKRKRTLRKPAIVTGADAKRMKRLVPNL